MAYGTIERGATGVPAPPAAAPRRPRPSLYWGVVGAVATVTALYFVHSSSTASARPSTLAAADAAEASTGKISLDAAWAAFVKQYGKTYASGAEETYRKSIFTESLIEAKRREEVATSAHFGVTKFSDWTLAEFMALQTAKLRETGGVWGDSELAARDARRATRRSAAAARRQAAEAAATTESLSAPAPAPIAPEDLDAVGSVVSPMVAQKLADDDVGDDNDAALGRNRVRSTPSPSYTPAPTPCDNGGTAYCDLAWATTDYYCETYWSSETGAYCLDYSSYYCCREACGECGPTPAPTREVTYSFSYAYSWVDENMTTAVKDQGSCEWRVCARRQRCCSHLE